jgi:hypothetical protein
MCTRKCIRYCSTSLLISEIFSAQIMGTLEHPWGALKASKVSRIAGGVYLNAYASAMAFDVAADSFFEDGCMPKEIDGSSTSR